MRKTLILLGISGLLLGGAALAQGALPYWAYPVTDKKFPAPDSTQIGHLPGTKVTFTRAGVNDRFNAPDWHPESHPKMPDIVAHGRKPGVFACGYCHLPNGQGRPENASVAGQPIEYIVQQVADMRSGRRKSSSEKMGSISGVIPFGQAEIHVGYDRAEAKGFTPFLVPCTGLTCATASGTQTIEQFKVTLQYNISKRTAMYTTGSWLKNKDDTRVTLPTAAGLTDVGGDSKGWEIGLRHFF